MGAKEVTSDVFAKFACCEAKIRKQWVSGGFTSFLSVVNIFIEYSYVVL